MAALFNSQASSFLPREDFFSQSETSLTINSILNESISPNSSSVSASSNNFQPNSSTNGCPSKSIGSSQPGNDTIVSRYKELIERRTIPGIVSIEELINWKPESRETIIGCVFGVVKSVRDSRGTRFKYVTLIDPTIETGIELETFGVQEKIAVGQMMKACNMKVQRTGSTYAFMYTISTKTSFFPLFSYNYDDPMGDERNKALTETRFSVPEDREICYILEKWFSYKIINGTKLSNLPKPGEFADICCQVLAFNKYPLSMNAVIWDTSKPNYKPLFGANGLPPLGFECINYDYFQVAYERYFALTVWKEESYDQAKHYDTFRCIDLTTKDDLVVLFNIQVIEDTNHPGKASLVMRSCRKWGKAVRLCHRNSILGQIFSKKCQKYRREFRRKLDLPESDEVEKPRIIRSLYKPTPCKSNTSTSTPEKTKLATPQVTPQSNIDKESGLCPQPESAPNLQSEPVNQTDRQEEELEQVNYEQVSRDESNDPDVEIILAQSNLPESNNLNSEALKLSRKRKATEAKKIIHSCSIYDNPVPSTSGYSLRSQRLTETFQATRLSPTDEETNVYQLEHLKTKSKGFLDWNTLLTNSLEGLQLLVDALEESGLHDENSPLAREEYINFLKFAIEEIKKQPIRTEPEPSASSSRDPNRSHESSNDSDSIYPVYNVDRVKFTFS